MILEGIGVELIPSTLKNESHLIPHWVFVFLIFIVIFYDRENTYFAILYGAIFGLLIDIVYTDVLGIYMFSYAMVSYAIRLLKKLFHENFYVLMCLGLVGICLADLAIYAIYFVIGITNMIWNEYYFYRLLPTALANLIFLIVLYPLFGKRLMKWRSDQLSSR